MCIEMKKGGIKPPLIDNFSYFLRSMPYKSTVTAVVYPIDFP